MKWVEFDINLYTPRGDGNVSRKLFVTSFMSDINSYTSKGDGNTPVPIQISRYVRYKPIYLERGRKRTLFQGFVIITTDINLTTSRGDGN